MKQLLPAALLMVAGSAFLGCASDPPPPPAVEPPPPPTRVSLRIETDSDLNPDVKGRPSPLLLRIYQLKSPAAFNGADFFALYQNEKAALAEDLIQKEELILSPGETRSLNFEPKPEAQIVAAFAAFRDLATARWRGAVSIVPHQANAIDARLYGTRLELVAAPPAPKAAQDKAAP